MKQYLRLLKGAAINTLRPLALATFSGLILFVPLKATLAQTFGETKVDESKFIAVASPIGTGESHQLLIIEQIKDERPCWGESGSNPTIVDPLLAKFNFAGICSRSLDANGYSIRVGGQDLGLKYLLRIRNREGSLFLVAVPDNPSEPEITIGSTGGTTNGFAKIFLNSGWSFAKRTFTDTKTGKEKTLGHVYLSAPSLSAVGLTPNIPSGSSLPFRDVAGDIYLEAIQEAVALQFIKGFEDNTFRPQTALTREQIVSMILEALKTLPNSPVTIPATTPTSPYPDVKADRWSAAKIAYARQNNIVSGYEDGSFRPTQAVTRAELMALLRRASEYALTLQGKESTLSPDSAPTEFSDIEGHWAQPLIKQMSAYCGVASPLNERGTLFAPNESGLRNYAAAATLRMLTCVKR